MTLQNNPGRLTNKVILSMPYNPSGGTTQTTIDTQVSAYMAQSTGSVLGKRIDSSTGETVDVVQDYLGTRPSRGSDRQQNPDHWQDFIPDVIYDKTMGNNTHKENTSALGLANEFELDVEQIVHTWQTLTGVMSLPGLTSPSTTDGYDPRQLNCVSIDLGMMREIIVCKGVLYDRDTHPSSTSGHHIRRQHLLDIVRSQWAKVHNYNRAGGWEWNDPNRFPALTIGPKYGIPSSGGSNVDAGYYGDEPSSDIRGHEVRATPTDNLGEDSAWQIFDNTPHYSARRRYRGMIKKLSLNAVSGQPDIWRYQFDFIVIKNELELRTMNSTDEDLFSHREAAEE